MSEGKTTVYHAWTGRVLDVGLVVFPGQGTVVGLTVWKENVL